MTNAVNIAGLGGALTVTSGVVNFSSTPTVNSSPIGASAATPTVLGTVYAKQTTGGGSPYLTAFGPPEFSDMLPPIKQLPLLAGSGG